MAELITLLMLFISAVILIGAMTFGIAVLLSQRNVDKAKKAKAAFLRKLTGIDRKT